MRKLTSRNADKSPGTGDVLTSEGVSLSVLTRRQRRRAEVLIRQFGFELVHELTGGAA